MCGGYGFLSVFACAMTFRSAERAHDYHQAMHEVVERLERLMTLFVLLVLGIALTRGLLESLDWRSREAAKIGELPPEILRQVLQKAALLLSR